MTFPKLTTLASASAFGLVLAASAASGQPYYASDPSVGGVTVYAPRHLGRTSIGAPIEIVRESRVVYTADLDLSTPWGARALHRRIQRAAFDACNDLDSRYTVIEDDNGRDCYRSAVRGAYDEIAYRTNYPAYAGY
ncbi:MAG TPA: UrcA family protein [Caulobacteraceae bacterium]|jgi:UrcA family protein